jgi:cyclase
MKKRIIPSILLRGGTNVSLSQQFTPWRTVGALAQQLRLHVRRSCDELLIINIDLAGTSRFSCPHRLLSLVRQEVDIPIAYAGGISSLEDAASCINAGFDKVYLTSAFIDNTSVVSAVSSVIGSQSTGVCLPYRRSASGDVPFVWDFRASVVRLDLPLLDVVRSAVALGAGEILLYDVDRDGSLQGLDVLLLNQLEDLCISAPVLMAGGAGNEEHFSTALASPALQGVVAGSIFALTQETPATIRSHCESKGIAMRRP